MRLLDMTSPEVDELPRDIVALLPCGAVEQHSLHLPLCTDAAIIEAIASAAADSLPQDCLLLPTLWLGASHHHAGFAGTLSASTSTHSSLVQDVVLSLIRHRFERIFVLNGHGGNEDTIGAALRSVADAHPETTLAWASYWTLARTRFAEMCTGPMKEMGHACEVETSLMLAIRPDLVRTDRADDDCLSLTPSMPGVELVSEYRSSTVHGGIGYPSHATAEKGRAFLEAAVAATVSAIRALRAGVYWRSSAS